MDISYGHIHHWPAAQYAADAVLQTVMKWDISDFIIKLSRSANRPWLWVSVSPLTGLFFYVLVQFTLWKLSNSETEMKDVFYLLRTN